MVTEADVAQVVGWGLWLLNRETTTLSMLESPSIAVEHVSAVTNGHRSTGPMASGLSTHQFPAPEVVSKWTGVPVEKVSSDESARLVQLEEGIRLFFLSPLVWSHFSFRSEATKTQRTQKKQKTPRKQSKQGTRHNKARKALVLVSTSSSATRLRLLLCSCWGLLQKICIRQEKTIDTCKKRSFFWVQNSTSNKQTSINEG